MMHHDKVEEGVKKKPHIILHYHDTKNVVSNVDHLSRMYSCRRKINRWPMPLFFHILDVAGIASFIVWVSNNPDKEGSCSSSV